MQQFPARQKMAHSLSVSQLTVNEDEHITGLIREKAHHIRRCTTKTVDIPEPHDKPTRVGAQLGGAPLHALREIGGDGGGILLGVGEVRQEGVLGEGVVHFGEQGPENGCILAEEG